MQASWMSKISAPAAAPAAPVYPEHPMVARLKEAGERFDARSDSFAQGKGGTCRFGRFVSDRQAEFAGKLVEWSRPRQPAQAAPQAAPAAPSRPTRLHDVLQRQAKFYAGKLTIACKNQDRLCRIKHDDAEEVIGKIDNGILTLWARPGVDMVEVKEMLVEFEGNPLQAAMKYGKLAGRCCSCGRGLTDPASIESGIGPICAGKFAL